ncbi:MAG TPA: tRNA-dihydrouridine synthase [candidate division Zixibacteria bacterium]|nr:tRNA-dihydrouridine synthase [candidate division Zixibacteria bacterium]
MSNDLNIGALNIKSRVIAAPMAGITDAACRLMASRMGAGLTVTEMASVKGLLQRDRRTLSIIRTHPEAGPYAVQLFGCNESDLEEAAGIVQDEGADAVDVNMGCPVRKVIRKGAGAALLKTPQLASEIVEAAMGAKLSVSVKMRIGFEHPDIDGIIRLLESFKRLGVVFVTIHPRTASQGFSGSADWNALLKIAKKVDIPIVGNGDIFSVDDLRARLTDEIRGVAIARGAIANFQLFSQLRDYLEGREPESASLAERIETFINFIHDEIALRGERQGLAFLRKFFVHLVRGISGARRLRAKLVTETKLEEVIEILRKIAENTKINAQYFVD